MDKVEVLQKMLRLLDSRCHTVNLGPANRFPGNQAREALMPPNPGYVGQRAGQYLPVVFPFVDFVPVRWLLNTIVDGLIHTRFPEHLAARAANTRSSSLLRT